MDTALPEATGSFRRRGPRLGSTVPAPALCAFSLALTLPVLARASLGDRPWVTFAFLAGLGLAAQALLEHGERRPPERAAAVVALAAAALLLPPELVALAACVLYAPQALGRREPVCALAPEVATQLVGALAAWSAAWLIRLALVDSLGEEGSFAVAAGGACLALAGSAHLGARARAHARRASGGEGGYRPALALDLATELILAALGVVLAAVWLFDPWLLPFAAAPLVLVRRSLRIPALEQEARLDPKTGLFNAAYFDLALERELARARALGRPLAVLVADLDLLREINALHGHLGGDAVLRGVGAILRAELRPQDVPARFGGEELAVVLPDSDLDGALRVAERLRRAVATASFRSKAGGGPIRASLSIGVAAFPQHGATATELVHLADLAVYRAKLQGRNRTVAADPLAETPLASSLATREGAGRGAEGAEHERDREPPAERRPAPRPSPALAPPAAALASLALALGLGFLHLDVALSASALVAGLFALALVLRRHRSDCLLAERALERAERLWRAADTVRTQTVALQRANRLLRERSAAALATLSAAIDARDARAAGHSLRVERVSLAIGRELGLSPAELEVLSLAARLHDVGKVAVPEAILLKPAPLDEEEWHLVRRHPEEGARLIERLGFLADALPAIRHHHERYDGSGYPDGLAGEEIPLGARIIHVADALDAMLTPRSYRAPLSPAEALAELRRGAGRQFCPRCLEALDRVMLAELAQGADVPLELLAS